MRKGPDWDYDKRNIPLVPLPVLFRFTASDNPFCVFKLFLIIYKYLWSDKYHGYVHYMLIKPYPCVNPVQGEVHSIQHYVILFVSDLRQVRGFLYVVIFICVQWVQMRVDCSFCWCWWNLWPPLFKLFFIILLPDLVLETTNNQFFKYKSKSFNNISVTS
jgi:hypothetical protein